MNTNVWIVSAGDGRGRDYHELFLKYGLMFIGDTLLDVNENDYVILKEGISKIHAVGKIKNNPKKPAEEGGAYDFLWDIDGWELPNYCFVDWYKPAESILGNKQSPLGLRMGQLYSSEKNKPKHLQWIQKIMSSAPSIPAPLPLPRLTDAVEDEDIIDCLISEGLEVGRAKMVTDAFDEIRRLARYYTQHCWDEILEHETRTFLVVPLLRALGWAPQQIKIEYSSKGGRMDIAIFNKPYRKEEGKEGELTLKLIIETKKLNEGLTYVNKQAASYAVNYPDCRMIVVTNGYAYRLFERDPELTNKFPEEPTAYLNLLRPRKQYPINPDIPGALEVFSRLLPTYEPK